MLLLQRSSEREVAPTSTHDDFRIGEYMRIAFKNLRDQLFNVMDYV